MIELKGLQKVIDQNMVIDVEALRIEAVPWGQVLANLGGVLAISTLLYAVVVRKVRRSDR